MMEFEGSFFVFYLGNTDHRQGRGVVFLTGEKVHYRLAKSCILSIFEFHQACVS